MARKKAPEATAFKIIKVSILIKSLKNFGSVNYKITV